MKINGKDVSDWNAKQWNVVVEHNDIKNDSEWVRGSLTPILLTNDVGTKKITVSLLVKGKNRDKILQNRSDVIANLLDPVELELDGFEHKFHVIANKIEPTESSKHRFHLLKIEFLGYEYGQEVVTTIQGNQTIYIENAGNIKTPAIVEIVPDIGITEVTLTGLCHEQEDNIVIRELTSASNVIINGETGMITDGETGKYKDVELWELPSLLPGVNKITCDKNNVTITIRHKPRFI